MLDIKIIAEPRTIKLALEAATLSGDYERARIIKRVRDSGQADMDTILKYRDVNINERIIK